MREKGGKGERRRRERGWRRKVRKKGKGERVGEEGV